MPNKKEENKKMPGRQNVDSMQVDASSGWLSTRLLLSALVASISVNIALLYASWGRSVQNNREWDTCLQPLDHVKMDLYSAKEHREIARKAFDEASQYSGERGEGRLGWWGLLKAWDYDRNDELLGDNLMTNYGKLDGYSPIGWTELKAANWSEAKMRRVAPNHKTLERQIETTRQQWKSNGTDPGPGCPTLAFATRFGRWDLSKILRNVTRLNEEIYETTIRAYLQLKEDYPELSPTDLNHALWKLQKAVLDRETQSYWGGFQKIDQFRDLVFAMRHAAKRFLGDGHGLEQDDAERKASHPLVVWVSVHTLDSVHQPHVTLDALVGGVYYVNVPQGSGRLELYDPRGKSPLDLRDPNAPSQAPFHRTIGIEPKPGTLVLFPGWLVHSVLPSKMNSSKSGYRVSISLNLKGEWQATGGLSVGCPTYS